MPNTEHLRTMLQDLINDRPEQATVAIHDYFVAKTREISGLASTEHAAVDEVDEVEEVDANEYDESGDTDDAE